MDYILKILGKLRKVRKNIGYEYVVRKINNLAKEHSLKIKR